MSQSDDCIPFNLWGNSDFWSSTAQTQFVEQDVWAPAKLSTLTHFSKLNGIVSLKDHERVVDQKNATDTGNSMPWVAVGSGLHEVDLPSIWSAPKLYPSSDQNLSLSDHLSWTPVSNTASNDVGRVPVELWDSSRDTLHFPAPDTDTESLWKATHVSSGNDSTPLEVGTTSAATFTVAGSITSSGSTPSILTSNAPGSTTHNFETGSSQTIPNSTEDSSSLTPLSTEQLCDHLINSNEGWGRRPVDQTTPWDSIDVSKSGDHLVRSGITTPTPASHPSGGTNVADFATFRAPLQAHSTESNIWINETPTGTAIWEMNYESAIARGTVWHSSLTPPNSSVPSSSDQAPANPLLLTSASGRNLITPSNSILNRAAPHRPWDQADKLWTSGNVAISNGRPVLGSARSTITGINQSDDITGWCNVDPTGNGNVLAESSNSTAPPWEGFPVAAGGQMQWNSNSGSSFMTNEDQHHHHQNANNPFSNKQPSTDRMLINPFNNTYRADSVKYLISHGFKKEEALPALIACNMDPERALHELRERYNNNSSCSSFNLPSSGFQPNFGNVPSHFPNTNSFTQSSQQPGSGPSMLTSSGVSASAFSGPNHHRGKLLGNASNASAVPLLSMPNHPNQQLIRQQLTQQVRSALNLSMPPNAMNGPMNNGSVIGAAGTSLLGQPPPPLLNGGGSAGSAGAPPSAAGSNYLPPHNRNQGSIPTAGGALPPYGKRSARQMTIIAAIQDLHKKHQSIQQQMIMYQNNPTMCSQPQYADLFTELQGQMQQIEAQLKAKQAQLNIAYAQDCAVAAAASSSSLGQPLTSPLIDGPAMHLGNPNCSVSVGSNNPSAQTMGAFQQNRNTQEQLVQQLMELRLRPGGSSSTGMDGETEFPTIGTWTPYKGNNMDNADKLAGQDGSGTRSTSGLRTGVVKNRNQSNWGSNMWQPSNQRSNVNPPSNWSATQVDGAMTMTHPNGLRSSNLPPVGGGMMEQQQSCSGPWLLIQPTPTGGLSSNPSVLHNLLCHYGLTYFHALNPASGSVLVRLQSPEYAFQLMRALGDRLTVESITDPEKLLQVQKGMNTRENYTPGRFSPTCDGASNWTTHCDPSVNPNTIGTAVFPPKKPTSAHNVSRLGVMVSSGMH